MPKIIGRYFILVIAIFILASCAEVPKTTVWRPWTRVLGSSDLIKPGSAVSLTVEGECPPLLGSNALLEADLTKALENMLVRRGFKVVKDNPEYMAILRYRSIRHDMIRSSTFSIPTYSFAQSWGQYGYGIAAASMVGATTITTSMTSIPVTNIHSQKTYTHVLGLDILDKNKIVLWQGEATWDDIALDLSMLAPSVLQLVASALPKAGDVPTKVEAVRTDAAQNYYDVYCKDMWFSCPALPYWISFHTPSWGSDLPHEVYDPEAFPAYLDLIKTAEFALPLGGSHFKKPSDDPLDPDNWTWVELGREYLLGPDEKLVQILIKLRGTEDGYEISECKIATPEEYRKFLDEMAIWQNALKTYFDFYQGRN